MKNRLKSVAALGVVTATLLSLTSCSALSSDLPDETNSSPQSGFVLPVTWQEAAVTWTESGPIKEVTSLPKNIAYVAERETGDEFLMYSPAGKPVVRIGTPEELPDAKSIEVEETFVDGKTYLEVIQMSGAKYVVTGFDEDGKQLFRKVELERADRAAPTLDPITGESYVEVAGKTDWVPSANGRLSKVTRVIDGVQIRNEFDEAAQQTYIVGPGWERAISTKGPDMTYVNSAGRFLCFSKHVRGFFPSELIDVHTGNEVPVDKDGITSCMNDSNGVVDSQVITSRSIDVMSPIAEKNGLTGTNWKSATRNDASYLVVPGLGRAWNYPVKENFLPYSYDPIAGRVYGYLVRNGEFAAAAMDATDASTLILLKRSPRAPLAVTGGGIGMFPAPTFDNLAVGMNGGSIAGKTTYRDTVFAVKSIDGS